MPCVFRVRQEASDNRVERRVKNRSASDDLELFFFDSEAFPFTLYPYNTWFLIEIQG